jgi:metacaspase-1
MEGVPLRKHKRVRFDKSEMKWIVLSGCGEKQTSADAFISRRYNGAFTYYALKTLKVGMTYNEWIKAINAYLPSKNYDQVPTLEGNEKLFSKPIFN